MSWYRTCCSHSPVIEPGRTKVLLSQPHVLSQEDVEVDMEPNRPLALLGICCSASSGCAAAFQDDENKAQEIQCKAPSETQEGEGT
eukprot:5133381-Amphidinium_carterae.1